MRTVLQNLTLFQEEAWFRIQGNKYWSRNVNGVHFHSCFSALQLSLRSTLIPKHQCSPSQNLCKRSWAKNGKRSNRSSVVKEFHAKLPVTRITSEICTCVPRYSTCKQSAARSETPKAWLPCCKAVGRKKDPPAITQITSLVLFFPTFWQQLTTASEVQLSYRYKTFHNSQKNKDTQNRILFLITWYISAHKKRQKYVTTLFKLLSAWYAILLSLIVLPMLLNTGSVWWIRLMMSNKATKGKPKNIYHSGAVVLSLPVQGQFGWRGLTADTVSTSSISCSTSFKVNCTWSGGFTSPLGSFSMWGCHLSTS